MASETPSPPAVPRPDSGPKGFTLQIISPSVGVPQPLAFPKLSAETTVRQLKALVRDAIDSKPTDQAQRLIHRGRLLSRDNETMLELFGHDALDSADRQTLHLVLRDLSDSRPAFTPTPPSHSVPSQAPPATTQPSGIRPNSHAQPPLPPQLHGNAFPAQQHVRFGMPAQQPNIMFGYPPQVQFGAVNTTQLPPGWPPQHLMQHQREAMARMGVPMGMPNVNQGAPPMTTMGMQPPYVRGTPGSNTPGRTGSPYQPDATRTVVREGIGLNGQQWRITVNESVTHPLQRPGRSSSPFPSGEAPGSFGLPARSVPNGDTQPNPQASDVNSATRIMMDAMRRNASSSSLANLTNSQSQPPIPPGVTTPLVSSRSGSAAGTPDPQRAAGRHTNALASQSQGQPPLAAPEVYILSSPNGPRALLLNSSLETYVSPQAWGVAHPTPLSVPLPMASRPFVAATAPPTHMPFAPPPQIYMRQRTPATGGNLHNSQPNNAQNGQQPQGQPQQGLPQPQIGHAVAQPNNPQVHAIRVAQVWPHIWMIIRLGLFIWWFTSPTSSWSRWITVISIAIALFVVNTGLLNPMVEQFWTPLRRHIENMIPLAADNPRQQNDPRAANARGDLNPQQRGDPNPEDTAARLVQERRRGNANWLLNQARRLERAGILFLASIAPGLAERHIAHVEAEARAAERQRQEAEAAAAAATVETRAATAEAADGTERSPENNEIAGQSQASGDTDDGAGPAHEQQPLIAT
ncbi:hypothetical protein F5Y15DRAFT_400321 [Xylariaceae sp. FL0016]|nr:hypothetical protein F5Y15DRAFT_400321 [Xylariaceae sp. FL0016]